MRYFGGKARIAKRVADFLNGELKNDQTFVDLFCGSCNVLTKVDPHRKRIANDKHPYLIAMWKALQDGWTPPTEMDEETYKDMRTHGKVNYPIHLIGFVGFGCSFSGKWFGGFAKSRGDDYLGQARRGALKKAEKLGRNYCLNAHNSVLKKVGHVEKVEFFNEEYYNVVLPDGSLVYCDIPYKDTTPYDKKLVGAFDHEKFYQWCREKENMGIAVYVSEYHTNVPADATVVFQVSSSKCLRNKAGVQEETTEVIYRFI